MNNTPAAMRLSPDDRFERFQSIEWWNQLLLQDARVLVVGAGALGNEVIKNLCLLGVGNLVIVDLDRIERSNLTRSVLFREGDEGVPKAERAAQAAKELYPAVNVQTVTGNVLFDVGQGVFRWAQVIVGALDNREARVYVNSVCAKLGRPWIDGGIEVLQGIVRGFAPPQTACYECTMSQVDWDLINQRRSCAMLARRAQAQRGTATTPTTASVVGGMQAQEVVKILHGMDALTGAGFVFEGASHTSYKVSYPIHPDCPWHDPPPTVIAHDRFGLHTRLDQVWHWAAEQLHGLDALDLGRELVEQLECPKCQKREHLLKPVDRISEEEAPCPHCGTDRVPHFVHSLSAGDELLKRSAAELGLPAWDILWARRDEQVIGIEFSGDRPAWAKTGEPTT